jgi:G:T/U-mismatch repair DNA glycosylase
VPPRQAPSLDLRPQVRPIPGPHLAELELEGRLVRTLADLPPQPDRLLFVGLNPSPVSVDGGHYHRGPLGRRFWGRLVDAGILPPDLDPELGDDALLAAGHGITDLLKRPSARDTASDAELRAGVVPLWQKVTIWRPAAIVFIYKRAAEAVAGRRLEARWGQLRGVAVAARPAFLMPAPYAPAADTDAGLEVLRSLVRALPRR